MTPRATPLTPDERRRTIVEAVVPLILESGAMPTTREIAQAAGVAEGTIFRVFDDKTALLWAVAEHVLAAPPGVDPAGSLAADPDLLTVLTSVVERLQGNMRRVGTILMLLRQQMASQAHDKLPDGPPAFIVEANQRLLDRLTLVFERYAGQLTVEPRTAALALRSLVFGAHHPGMTEEPSLSAAQVATLVLHGVARPPAAPPAATPSTPARGAAC